MVEAFAIHTDNGTLGDKGPRVDIIDDLKDRIGLALFCQHEHHLYRFPRVKPCPVDHSHATVQGINLPSDLFIFIGNDKELD